MADGSANRRNFIKGAAAGLAGVFLSLRGAQPASAASPQVARRIKRPLRYEYFPQRGAELDTLMNALVELYENPADDGGPPLTEPAARAEWIVLGKEQVQWQARQEIVAERVRVEFLTSFRLRRGEFESVIVTIQELHDGILVSTSERFITVWRGFDGDLHTGDAGSLQESVKNIEYWSGVLANPIFPREG